MQAPKELRFMTFTLNLTGYCK